MESLEISTAVHCPLRCRVCPQGVLAFAYSSPIQFMSLETLRRALWNSKPIETISFAGFAEPFINQDAAKMLRMAKDVAVREVTLYTTAVGMSKSDIATVVATTAWVTLHLPDTDMQWAPTQFYVSVVRELLERHPDVRPMTLGTLHPLLERELKGYDIARGLYTKRAGHLAHLGKDFQPTPKEGPLICKPSRKLDHPVLLPDGTVVVCCQDYGMEHALGNLAEKTWDEIREGPGMQRLKAAMVSGKCLCRMCEYAG